MARKSGIEGLSNLRKVLRRLPGETTADLRETLEFGAGMILRGAQGRAKRWRRIAENLSMKASRDKLTWRIGIIGVRAKKRAYMAKWIHYGVRPHSLKKGSRMGGHGRSKERLAGQKGGFHPGIPANPYLFNSFEERKRPLVAMVRASIDRTLKRGAGKA